MKRSTRTPWKKSRTYGDLYGGRTRRRWTDNIVARTHSLQRPAPGESLPILLEDNPSRDYYFPVSVSEVAAALATLPESHQSGITHIWLRRISGNKAQRESPLAEFVCGSGVRAIVLYAWRVDGVLPLGKARPSQRYASLFASFGGLLAQDKAEWKLTMTEEGLKRFYLEHLLCHEVGHHVDWYRRNWSAANARQCEDFADQYAVVWGEVTTEVLSAFTPPAAEAGHVPG